MSSNGNFADMPKEDVRELASQGGKASGKSSGGTESSAGDSQPKGKQGFASMDADKQREIASMGGKASSGSFEPGSEKAREAGRKGGSANASN